MFRQNRFFSAKRWRSTSMWCNSDLYLYQNLLHEPDIHEGYQKKLTFLLSRLRLRARNVSNQILFILFRPQSTFICSNVFQFINKMKIETIRYDNDDESGSNQIQSLLRVWNDVIIMRGSCDFLFSMLAIIFYHDNYCRFMSNGFWHRINPHECHIDYYYYYNYRCNECVCMCFCAMPKKSVHASSQSTGKCSSLLSGIKNLINFH